MKRFFVSKTGALVIAVFVMIGIVVFNYYDIKVNNYNNDGYTNAQIESMDVEYVNINEASVDLLAALPGVSESVAENIVDYRNEHGDFQSIEELKEVKGIGDKMFDKLKFMVEI